MTETILLVDDEPNILQGFKRHLRKDYQVELAVGGKEALKVIKEKGPFAIVVSDMQMPEMSGAELLRRVKDDYPSTVRVMLTGNADQNTAAVAVNEGQIFRFLNKPCPPDQLAKTLDSGLEHYRLITAEAELLNKTLAGSVRMLTQVLSLTMPELFGFTYQARQWAKLIAPRLGIGPAWEVEIAAMLMHVGFVALPRETIHAYLSDGSIGDEHQSLIDGTSQLAFDLISVVPRLENVAEIVRRQYDVPSDPTPQASRVLHAIADYQRFVRHQSSREVLERLKDKQTYDPYVVQALGNVITETRGRKAVGIDGLKDGMILHSGIQDNSGRLLLAAGMEVHQAMIQKLTILAQSATGVREPIEIQTTETDDSDMDESSVEVSHLLFEGV
ncbi:response regulator [Roseiconus lacunae]|uniref:response regulator n=1 Tax=Roseiconus lacunae TaxID=2605694 RepID=UPI001E3BFE05|nr:response regulator [Roseiconus lacunae]MCD0460184.1 response regulator [Roseiconus lacunae]